ncbi:hypothetical protein AAVH_37476, partial [Aphelenchoides avenae]
YIVQQRMVPFRPQRLFRWLESRLRLLHDGRLCLHDEHEYDLLGGSVRLPISHSSSPLG